MRNQFILLFFVLIADHVDGRPTPKHTEFCLNGVVIGRDSGLVMLKYEDDHNNVVLDTLMLNKGKFHFSGTVNRVCEAFLTTDLSAHDVDDSSRIRFLLEPGNIFISYRAHTRPIIRGSRSQTEKDHWDHQKLALLRLREKYFLMISALATRYGKDPKPVLKDQIASVQRIRDSINRAIRALDVEYIKTHPNAGLSASLLWLQVRYLPLDTAEMLYNGIAPWIRKSTLGHYTLSYIYPLAKDGTFRQANPLRDAKFTQRLSDLNSVHDLVLSDTSGGAISLNTFKARYYVIDFWASWCKPCIENIPALEQMCRDYAKDSIQFISISLDTKFRDWKQALLEHHFTGTQLHDPNSFSGLSAVYCKVLWVPTYVIADREGRIIRYNAPQAMEPGLRAILDQLIGHRGPG